MGVKFDGIASEEKYIQNHAKQVDSTIHSKEYQQGTAHYILTGQPPHDKFWSNLSKEYHANPEKFTLNHPLYAGFFTPPSKLGELPQNFVFDVMKERDTLNHGIFAASHPFYVSLVDHDLILENTPPINPGCPIVTCPAGPTGPTGPTGPMNGVPEPLSGLMLAFALMLAYMTIGLIRS